MSTINDVAEASGVTIGTVDRVLHERGEVSEKTREKVLRAVRELGYKPNVYASMLARNKSHRDCRHHAEVQRRRVLGSDSFRNKQECGICRTLFRGHC